MEKPKIQVSIFEEMNQEVKEMKEDRNDRARLQMTELRIKNPASRI